MIVTMYRRKWKFSVMSAEDAEDFIRQPHFERIRFISITEANSIVAHNNVTKQFVAMPL